MLLIFTHPFKTGVIIPISQTGRLRLRESKVSWQVCNKSMSTCKVHATLLLASGGITYEHIKKIEGVSL